MTTNHLVSLDITKVELLIIDIPWWQGAKIFRTALGFARVLTSINTLIYSILQSTDLCVLCFSFLRNDSQC